MNLKEHLEKAKKLSTILDTQFNILGFKFGLDPLLDLVPGAGSVIGGIISCYLFWIAYQLKVPSYTYVHMALNIFLDTILGEIPIIGTVFDAFYKSNIKNLALLEKFIKKDVLEAEVVE